MDTYRVFSAILLLSLSIVLTGCGHNNVESELGDAKGQRIADNKVDAKESFSNFSIQCDDQDNCSQSSAAILVYNSDRSAVDVCTAFLIDRDKIMTNSHCVKHFKPGSNCTASMKVIFPANKQEIAYCKSVIKKGDLKKDLDYAVIKLDRRLNRKALKVSAEGLVDGDLYSMESVHVTNSLNARMIRQAKCKAVQNSMAYPNYRTGKSAHVILGDCETQHGYSGSAIVNSNGEVVAINSNVLEINDFNLRMNPKTKYIEADQQLAYVKAENLHCVLAPGINESITDICKAELPIRKRKTTGAAGLERKYALEKRIYETNEAYKNLHFTTKFEFSEISPDNIVTLVPTCIKDPAIWESEYKNILTILGLKKRKRDRIEVPVFNVEAGFNKYYQMDYIITEEDLFKAKYKYPIREKDITDESNTVKFKMQVKTLRPRAQLLNLLFPLFWFFPIEDDMRKDWIKVFEKDIPRCTTSAN